MRLREIIDLDEDVWHASPHRFDRFQMSNMGGGEGGQAFGWGLYFTDSQAVADWYRAQFDRRFSRSHVYKVQIPDTADFLLYEVSLDGQSAKVRKVFQAAYPLIAGKIIVTERAHGDGWGDFEWVVRRGKQVLRRGRELTSELAQEKAKAALQPSKPAYAALDGEKLYHALCQGLCDKADGYDPRHYRRQASMYLRDRGIAGIKYRNGVGSGFNYVIFDENNAVIADAEDRQAGRAPDK